MGLNLHVEVSDSLRVKVAQPKTRGPEQANFTCGTRSPSALRAPLWPQLVRCLDQQGTRRANCTRVRGQLGEGQLRMTVQRRAEDVARIGS